jgi:hypothetical protein
MCVASPPPNTLHFFSIQETAIEISGSHGNTYEDGYRPDGGSKLLWNIGHYLPDYNGATSQNRRQPSSCLWLLVFR